MHKINFEKHNGLIPVVIQHFYNQQVLMVGFMNPEAYQKTITEGKVTFYSRSKKRLWTKGESSGNFLIAKEIFVDCDEDTLLIKAIPEGPTCHRGTPSCFEENYQKGFLYELQAIQNQRIENQVSDSYTYKLFQKGINKVAQKVGEEAVELIIEAKEDNIERFQSEAADLLYHFLLLLKMKNLTLEDIEKVLKNRHKKD